MSYFEAVSLTRDLSSVPAETISLSKFDRMVLGTPGNVVRLEALLYSCHQSPPGIKTRYLLPGAYYPGNCVRPSRLLVSGNQLSNESQTLESGVVGAASESLARLMGKLSETAVI